MIAHAEPIVLTGIVVSEVLQGLTREVERVERYLAKWEMLEPRGFGTYRTAAAIFRLARSRGVKLTTTDTLIAAIALEHGASVFSLDKDFAHIARLMRLSLHRVP
jgi:predicted nucleic acid-binding protein